jgi:integrase
MARITKSLTNKEIINAKAKDKKYKLYDGGGLFLQVLPNGSKLWRLKYRLNGKEKEYAIGSYPTIILAKARNKKEELKQLIADGIDPNELKKINKLKAKQIETKKENTFYNISQKWLKSYKSEVSENYHLKLGRALENYTYTKYPTVYIKNKPIDEITRLDIIAILEALKNKGLEETAKRTAMLLNKVFKYAVTHEYAPHNIIADIDLKVVLGKRIKKHYPTFTKEKDIKGLLMAIDNYSGDYYTKMALKILPYVFVRSYNIRYMEWQEIDFKAKEWVIPAHKMKTKKEFILPLPHQVITLLQEIKEYSTNTKYVFPSFRSDGKPLSDNTLIAAIRRMGYSKDEFVPHGFRAMFSTIVSNKGKSIIGNDYSTEVREALLAHKETNNTIDAYNHADYTEQKRTVMQWYANYLDGVKNARM